MTPKEAQNWYRRACRYVKANKPRLKLKTIPDIYGKIEWGEIDEPDTILVNPRYRTPFMRTVIHEIIHAVDYDMTHRDVLRIEAELFKAWSDRKLDGLLRRLFT